ncbi:MAG TPA: arsenite efflux transporter metallochaperone ArsD [Patescibacteria group bacterium]|nr:arsenite efflux transporter metallochaperone ArsD [Patescibacteria group bacterium]
MKTMVIYDPAMCCSTGVCGASVDQELLRVATTIDNLKKGGADITRFNLAHQPQAYSDNTLISEQLKQYGPEILPITLVNGAIVKSKIYPSQEEFMQWTGVVLVEASANAAGCCCGPKGCC